MLRTSYYLIKNNYNHVISSKKVDVIIFVTCAFLNDVTEKNFKKIGYLALDYKGEEEYKFLLFNKRGK